MRAAHEVRPLAEDVAETDERLQNSPSAAQLYRLLSNPRHNTGHPVIWIEWLLSTLFDASLLTPEPPLGGSFFAFTHAGTPRALRLQRIAALSRNRHAGRVTS